MRRRLGAAAAALALITTAPAHADILIDNVTGLTPDGKGGMATFSAVLVGDDGRIAQVLARSDKKPAKVTYRLDGKGKVMIPGLIDSHERVMDLGLVLLKAKAGFTGTPRGEPRPEDRDLAFAEAQALLLRTGITTVADMGTTIADWQAYRRAGDADALRIRLVAYAATPGDMALIGGPRPTPWLYGDRLKQNGLSLVLDGRIEDGKAWRTAPGAGQPRVDPIQLRNMMSRGAIDNFQVALTAQGEGALTAALDAIAELALTYGGDRRWRIEGASMVADADLSRFTAHGVVASLQPGKLAAHASVGEGTPGTDRWRSIARAGAMLAFGSDTDMAPPTPFADMALAISRRVGDDATPVQPQEALNRQEALAAWTAGGAHALFAEGKLGRIAAGLRADFLLIDRDPLLASPDELRETRVLEVWIGGQLAWKPDAPASPPTPQR